MKAKILRKLSILKLWKLTPFTILSWTQILKAYSKEWLSTYKDFRSMEMALTRTLRKMLKQKLIEKPQKGQYQLTEKGIQFYKINVEKIIKLTKSNLRKLIVVV